MDETKLFLKDMEHLNFTHHLDQCVDIVMMELSRSGSRLTSLNPLITQFCDCEASHLLEQFIETLINRYASISFSPVNKEDYIQLLDMIHIVVKVDAIVPRTCLKIRPLIDRLVWVLVTMETLEWLTKLLAQIPQEFLQMVVNYYEIDSRGSELQLGDRWQILLNRMKRIDGYKDHLFLQLVQYNNI